MKLSRRQLRKMILKEMHDMSQMGDHDEYGLYTRAAGVDETQKTYTAEIVYELRDWCQNEQGWICAVSYDRETEDATMIISHDENMFNSIRLDFNDSGVSFGDGTILPYIANKDEMLNQIARAIEARI